MQTLHSADYHSSSFEPTFVPTFRTPVDGGGLGNDYHRGIDWTELRKKLNGFGKWLCSTAPFIAVFLFAFTGAIIAVVNVLNTSFGG